LRTTLWISIFRIAFLSLRPEKFTSNTQQIVVIPPRSTVPAYDLKSFYRSLIHNSWYKFWHSLSSNKLRSIKKTAAPWSTSNRTSRYEEILLTWLWIGHTRLTHTFLYLGLFTPPRCQYCHQVELSVEHFFLCTALTNVLHSHSATSTLSTALSKVLQLPLFLLFLHLHLNPLFLSEPMTLSVVARLESKIFKKNLSLVTSHIKFSMYMLQGMGSMGAISVRTLPSIFLLAYSFYLCLVAC